MNMIISQKIKNVLKNKILSIFSEKVYQLINISLESILSGNINYRYISLISNLQETIRTTITSTLVSIFESLDEEYKNSEDRRIHYYINKSNVSRTLITIVGEISFSRTYYKDKNTGKPFFFIDSLFNLPKYDHYDPIVKGIAINNTFQTSQAQSARLTSSLISDISYFSDYNVVKNITRQSIFNWIKKWHVPNIMPTPVNTPEKLYIMADEKFIGCQDLKDNLMIKCFVAFEDIENVGKNRRELINRTVFSCHKTSAWPAFIDFLAQKYDFSKIKEIFLFGDGASWIKAGTKELRLESCNTVKFYLCQFHCKQAINNISTDNFERYMLFDVIKNGTKQDFLNLTNYTIFNNPSREETILKKQNYIINNHAAIKRMLDLPFGSSMESHISHLIASFFSSRPKGYSSKNIDKYLQLNDFKNNGYNIFNIYMNSYLNKSIITTSCENLNFSLFEKEYIERSNILKKLELGWENNLIHI